MFSFHRVVWGHTRPSLSAEIESRLPVGQSVVVIAGLSAISWAVLITIIMALLGTL
jgi:hypothetical protein